MEQGRCSLTPRTQRRSQNIVLTLQRYEIIWLLPNILVLFLFCTLNRGEVRREPHYIFPPTPLAFYKLFVLI